MDIHIIIKALSLYSIVEIYKEKIVMNEGAT